MMMPQNVQRLMYLFQNMTMHLKAYSKNIVRSCNTAPGTTISSL